MHPPGGGARVDSAYSWAVALATLTIASLSFGAATSVPILFVPMVTELGWSNATLSSVHLSAMVGAGAASLLIGRALDRWGFFVIAVVGAIATGAGLWIASRSHTPLQMILAYGLLVGALGQGAFFSPIAAAVSFWFARFRSLAVAIALTGQSVGGLVVPPALRLGAEAVGWRSALAGYAAATCALMLAASLLFLRRPPAAAAGSGPGSSDADGRDATIAGLRARPRALLWLALAGGCSNFATFGVLGHLAPYAEGAGLGAGGAAAMIAAMLGVTLVSRLGVGYLLDRRAMYPTLVSMSVLHLVGMLALTVMDRSAEAALAVMVVGIGFGGYLPAYGSLVRSIYPQAQAGRRLSELYFACFMGAGTGSVSVGIVRDLTGGFVAAFVLCTAMAATAVAILLLLRASLHRRSSHSGREPLQRTGTSRHRSPSQ